jgi:hypothetical protein
MFTRKRLLLAFALLLAVAGGLWFVIPPRKIHSENFQHIRNGMSREEVHELLGGPPGKYGEAGWGSLGRPLFPYATWSETWTIDDYHLDVYYSDEGKVCGKLADAAPVGRSVRKPIKTGY